MLLWAFCIYPIYKKKTAKPLFIEVTEKNLNLNWSTKPIPIQNIKAKVGTLNSHYLIGGDSIQFIDIKEGDALELEIQNFNEYFDISPLESLTPMFNEPGFFKIPIGKKGISEAEAKILMNALNDYQ